MGTDNYEKAFLDTLTGTEYYEKLSFDPSDQYKQSIGKETDQLKQMDYITDFEHSTLNEGNTLHFLQFVQPLLYFHLLDLFVVDPTHVPKDYQNGLTYY